jgi:hypothetical protein
VTATKPDEAKPVALPPPRPDAFQTGVRELLVQLYEQEYEQFLDEQVGFPLVKDRAGKIVRGEDLAALREQLRGLAADLPAFDALVQGERNSRPALLKARLAAAVPRIESILSALMEAEGQVARVRITYPGARDQQEAVGKAVNNLLAGAAFSVWRYVGSSLREPTWLADEEKEIGSFPVVSRDFELYFYRTADSGSPDGEPLRPLENWQLFTRLLEGTQEPKRRDDGLQWRVLYSRKDEQGRDRFFALTVLFPRPLPPLDRWPTFGQLKRR